MAKREDLEAAGVLIGEELGRSDQRIDLDWTKWNAERGRTDKAGATTPAQVRRNEKAAKEDGATTSDKVSAASAYDAAKEASSYAATDEHEDAAESHSDASDQHDTAQVEAREAGDIAGARLHELATEAHDDAGDAHAAALDVADTHGEGSGKYRRAADKAAARTRDALAATKNAYRARRPKVKEPREGTAKDWGSLPKEGKDGGLPDDWGTLPGGQKVR